MDKVKELREDIKRKEEEIKTLDKKIAEEVLNGNGNGNGWRAREDMYCKELENGHELYVKAYYGCDKVARLESLHEYDGNEKRIDCYHPSSW